MQALVLLVEEDVRGDDRDAPAVRHRVARVGREVQDDLLDVGGVDADAAEGPRELELDLDVFADEPREDRLHALDVCREVEDTASSLLLAAEREELPGDERRALGGADDVEQVFAHFVGRRQLVQRELRATRFSKIVYSTVLTGSEPT